MLYVAQAASGEALKYELYMSTSAFQTSMIKQQVTNNTSNLSKYAGPIMYLLVVTGRGFLDVFFSCFTFAAASSNFKIKKNHIIKLHAVFSSLTRNS